MGEFLHPEVRRYMATIGSKGGRRSRRKLSAEDARRMVAVREARRAFRRFRVRCFWSSPADLVIGEDDIGWVAQQLRKHGGMEGWMAAMKLCR